MYTCHASFFTIMWLSCHHAERHCSSQGGGSVGLLCSAHGLCHFVAPAHKIHAKRVAIKLWRTQAAALHCISQQMYGSLFSAEADQQCPELALPVFLAVVYIAHVQDATCGVLCGPLHTHALSYLWCTMHNGAVHMVVCGPVACTSTCRSAVTNPAR